MVMERGWSTQRAWACWTVGGATGNCEQSWMELHDVSPAALPRQLQWLLVTQGFLGTWCCTAHLNTLSHWMQQPLGQGEAVAAWEPGAEVRHTL